MAVPTVHRERGYRFRFFAADRDERVHVHVNGQGGRAKIWLTPTAEFASSRGYSRRDLETIDRIATSHRQAWIDAWRRFFE